MENRAIKFAQYIIDNNCTIRYTAKYFNISKSTVHSDVSNKLKMANYSLYLQVQEVLKHNFKVKHMRGGMATKEKYSKNKR